MTAAGRLAAILQSVPPRLSAISDDEAALQPAPGRWSKKEVLGHLIDSASNNHQRFVRTMLSPRIEFPAYEQESWVSAQAYRHEPWSHLVELWHSLNRHLLHIMRTVPEAALSHECVMGGKSPMTLAAFIEGYLEHLTHHLDQLLP